MKLQIETRLLELREELSSGQNLMAELEKKQQNLTQSMLRISGAVQVLEEMLDNNQDETIANVKKLDVAQK